MNIKTHSSFGYSSREHRLCFDTATLEAGIEYGREFLKSLPSLTETTAQAQLNFIGTNQNTVEYWSKALDGLGAEVQSTILGNLDNLRKKVVGQVTQTALEQVRQAAQQALQEKIRPSPAPSVTLGTPLANSPTSDAAPGIIDSTMNYWKEVYTDYKTSGWPTRTAYIVSGGVGFLLARYIYRKGRDFVNWAVGNTDEESKKEGGFGKTVKWLASITGAAYLLSLTKYGIDWMYGKTPETGSEGDQTAPPGGPQPPPTKEPSPTDKAFTTLGVGGMAAGEELYNGIKPIKKALGGIFEAAFNSESPTDALKMIAETGATLVWDEGKFIVMNEGKVITQPFELTSKTIEALKTGEMPEDLVALYFETGAVYFMHRKFVDVFMGRMGTLVPTKGSLIKVPLRIIGWPFEAAYRGAKITFLLRRPDGRAALLLNLKRNSLVGKMLNLRLEHGFIEEISTAEEALARLQKYEKLLEEIRIIDEFDETGFTQIFTKTDLERVNNIRLAMAKSLRDFGRGFSGVMPSDPVLRAIIEKSGNPEIGQFMEDIGHAMGKEGLREDIVSGRLKLTESTDPLGATTSSNNLRSSEQTRMQQSAERGKVPTGRAIAQTNEVVETTADTSDEFNRAWETGMNTLRDRKLSATATPDVLEAFDAASIRCKNLGLNLEQATALIENKQTFALLAGQTKAFSEMSNLDVVLRTASEEGVAGIQRIAAIFCKMEKVPTVLLDENIIRAFSKIDDLHPDAVGRLFSSLAGKKLLDTANPDQIVKTIQGLSRWQKAGSLARGLHVGFAALDVAMLGLDIYAYSEIRNRLTQTIQTMEGSLNQAGFVKDGNRWTHKGTGASVELKALEESVDSLSNPQAARIAADTAGLPLLAPCISFGPAGLALAGVILVVHAGITIWEQTKNREFLEFTPTPILAALTTSGTVGEHESDVLQNMSTWMISDMLFSSSFNETQKRLIRTKMIGILLSREIADMEATNPGITATIMRGKDISVFLDAHSDLFTADFDRVLKPFIAARLFQRSNDGTVSWKNFKDLKIDNGVFDLENVHKEDIAMILREAVYLYSRHVLEREYRRETDAETERNASRFTTQEQKIETIYQITSAEEIASEDAMEHEQLTQLGKQTVFGTEISALPIGATLIERLAHTVVKQLDDASATDDSLDAMRKRNPKLFSVELPKEARPDLTGNNRMMNIADLARESLYSPEKGHEQSFSVVLERAQKTFETLKPARGVMQVGESQYTVLSDYAAFLAQHSAYDPERWLQSKISDLGKNWYWMGVHPSAYMHDRNKAFYDVFDALAIHLSYLQTQAKEYDVTSQPTSPSYFNRECELLSVANVQTIHVALGTDAPQTLRGVPGQTISFDLPGVGELQCVSEETVDRKTLYTWTLKPLNARASGLKLTITAEENKDTHAQHERAIAELNLKRTVVQDGKVTYVRENDDGVYGLESNGTVSYRKSKSDTSPSSVYVTLSSEMVNDYHARGLDAEAPKGMWLPIHESAKPMVRAGEVVEVLRISDLVLNAPKDTAFSPFIPIPMGIPSVKIAMRNGTSYEGYINDPAFMSKVSELNKESDRVTMKIVKLKSHKPYLFENGAWKVSEKLESNVHGLLLSTTEKGIELISTISITHIESNQKNYKTIIQIPKPKNATDQKTTKFQRSPNNDTSSTPVQENTERRNAA